MIKETAFVHCNDNGFKVSVFLYFESWAVLCLWKLSEFKNWKSTQKNWIRGMKNHFIEIEEIQK